jgi:hypothetical protein
MGLKMPPHRLVDRAITDSSRSRSAAGMTKATRVGRALHRASIVDVDIGGAPNSYLVFRIYLVFLQSANLQTAGRGVLEAA